MVADDLLHLACMGEVEPPDAIDVAALAPDEMKQTQHTGGIEQAAMKFAIEFVEASEVFTHGGFRLPLDR